MTRDESLSAGLVQAEAAGAVAVDGPPADPRAVARWTMVYGSIGLFLLAILMTDGMLAVYMRDLSQRSLNATDPHSDAVTDLTATRLAEVSLAFGIGTFIVAGSAGVLGDRFGRQRCALVTALVQAAGTALISATAYLDLGFEWVLAGRLLQGSMGGFFVFISFFFSYASDCTTAANRAKAFMWLDGITVGVGALGPTVGAHLKDLLGWKRQFAVGAMLEVAAGFLFYFAPAPLNAVRRADLASWADWAKSFTPVLLVRTLLGDRERAAAYPAFLLFMCGYLAAPAVLVLALEQYCDHWDVDQIGYLSTASMVASSVMVFVIMPLVRSYLGYSPSSMQTLHLAMPTYIAYLLGLALLSDAAIPTYVYAALPLSATAFMAIPHFRALFSTARDAEHQGETLGLIAALESLPITVALPLFSFLFKALKSSSVGPRGVFFVSAAFVGAAWALLLAVKPPAVRSEAEEKATPAADSAP